jgi:hypothetical protein
VEFSYFRDQDRDLIRSRPDYSGSAVLTPDGRWRRWPVPWPVASITQLSRDQAQLVADRVAHRTGVDLHAPSAGSAAQGPPSTAEALAVIRANGWLASRPPRSGRYSEPARSGH